MGTFNCHFVLVFLSLFNLKELHKKIMKQRETNQLLFSPSFSTTASTKLSFHSLMTIEKWRVHPLMLLKMGGVFSSDRVRTTAKLNFGVWFIFPSKSVFLSIFVMDGQ